MCTLIIGKPRLNPRLNGIGRIPTNALIPNSNHEFTLDVNREQYTRTRFEYENILYRIAILQKVQDQISILYYYQIQLGTNNISEYLLPICIKGFHLHVHHNCHQRMYPISQRAGYRYQVVEIKIRLTGLVPPLFCLCFKHTSKA